MLVAFPSKSVVVRRQGSGAGSRGASSAAAAVCTAVEYRVLGGAPHSDRSLTRLAASASVGWFLNWAARRALPALAVFALGCADADGSRAARETGLDLLGRFPQARIREESTRFDFHGSAGSSIEFFALGTNDLRLELRAGSAIPGSGPDWTVGIWVNGNPVGESLVGGPGTVLSFDLPAAVLRPGENVLALGMSSDGMSANVAESDALNADLIAWDSIQMVGPAPRRATEVGVDGDWLVVPPGLRVDFYLSVPDAVELVIDEIEAVLTDHLRVETVRDHVPSARVLLAGSRQAQRVPLGGAGILRLAFSVESLESGDGSRPVRLRLPRIERQAGHEVRPVKQPMTKQAGTKHRRPNVLIYMVDTLRADRLGVYGSHRGLTPEIDRFAQAAVVFESAVAQSPWTRPSVASLFTGLLPDAHGVQDRDHRLSDDAVTLAEVLTSHGYESLGLTANPNVAARFGLGQGFERYHRATEHQVVKEAVTWLSERDPSGRPFFLYLHTVEPHAPYEPPEGLLARFASEADDPELQTLRIFKRMSAGEVPESDEMVARLLALYEAEIALTDQRFGTLLETLRGQDLDRETVVVFVSDHGEEFHEHGHWQHGRTLYTEVLDIPLIVSFPGLVASGKRVSEPVQHADLLPTLLAYLEIAPPPGVGGRNLMDAILGADSASFGAFNVVSMVDLGGVRGRSVTSQEYRFILPESAALGSDPELYERSTDPREASSIAAERPITTEYFKTVLESLGVHAVVSESLSGEQLDPELLEQLRALGYVE